MTSFNTLFNRMFQEKSKSVYLIFLIQAFASLCFTIIGFVSENGTPEFVNGKDTSSRCICSNDADNVIYR